MVEFLRVNGVSKKVGDHQILERIGFAQRNFQKLAIAGETGSGKSTLLKIIAGLDQPSEGEVLFESIRVKGPAEQLVPGHPQIAYLSQHFELPKSLRVEQVLSYVNALNAAEADLLFEVCRIAHLLQRKTDQLSGGERQRIALARLLSTSPRLLLLDEPYSNLDIGHKTLLKEVVRDVTDRLQITCILVSHDPADTLAWADEIIVMKAGRILQQGPPMEIYRKPVDDYTAGLFGRYSILDGQTFPELLKMLGPAIVRPEAFEITTDNQGGQRGRIRHVHFLGGHSDLEIAMNGHIIFVRTDSTTFGKGDEVWVRLR